MLSARTPIAEILRNKRRWHRQWGQQEDLIDKKIAILGGSTTAEIKEVLALYLLDRGLRPEFYESAYNRYYEEALFDNARLSCFAPDIIYIHTTIKNITSFPSPRATPGDVEALLEAESQRWHQLWHSLIKRYHCPIIQNNFEWPFYRMGGNGDSTRFQGRTHYIRQLNQRLGEAARQYPPVLINDINYLSATMGLSAWFDPTFWHAYRYALSYKAIPFLAQQLAAMMGALHGQRKKCLVLDLDNTLWGGVIGEEGVAGIELGPETPVAGAYQSFQRYVKSLSALGIILAICSKNEWVRAQEGLAHPQSVLHEHDFAAIRVNWQDKAANIRALAEELNIGLDSMVFVDDNPIERAWVRDQLPEVAVPEIGQDVTCYIELIEQHHYFETLAITDEDVQRRDFYQQNQQRVQARQAFHSYAEFLQSLEMRAQIGAFETEVIKRIVALIHKTNQFNLTTQRYSAQAVRALMAHPGQWWTLQGRLMDKFGDNGLVTLMIAERQGAVLHVRLWVMSCRVFKRGMEEAMFDALLARCRQEGVTDIIGYYRPSAKNGIVREIYARFGFSAIDNAPEESTMERWRYKVPKTYKKFNQWIRIQS